MTVQRDKVHLFDLLRDLLSGFASEAIRSGEDHRVSGFPQAVSADIRGLIHPEGLFTTFFLFTAAFALLSDRALFRHPPEAEWSGLAPNVIKDWPLPFPAPNRFATGSFVSSSLFSFPHQVSP
jgi:hypothetical protein